MLVTDVQTQTHTHRFDIQKFFSHPITNNVNGNCLQRILTKLIFGQLQGLYSGEKAIHIFAEGKWIAVTFETGTENESRDWLVDWQLYLPRQKPNGVKLHCSMINGIQKIKFLKLSTK